MLLLRTLTQAGHIAALFRRTYPELEENHLGPLFRQFPQLRAYYNSGRREIRIPGLESTFAFRYCEKASDVDRYAGREYHKVGIEEAGDWPADMALRLLRNCNRSTVPGIKASAAMTFNWGGIGHGGLKRLFVTRDHRDFEKKLSFNFIFAKVEDNPAILENDPGYLLRLESEPNEALRRAYRYGDPDIIAGQFFDLRRDVHVVDPFAVPTHWHWFGAYDYGYNHPAAIGFFAVDTDGRVFMVHEIVKAGMGIAEQARAIGDYRRKKIASGEMGERAAAQMLFHAGHDAWAKKKGKDPTIAEDMLDESVVGSGNTVTLVRANISRVLGATRVREFLRFEEAKRAPHFCLFKTCSYTIDCLTRMVHDPAHIEDVLKVDSSSGDPLTGDDPYDCVRMALMSRPALFTPQAAGPKFNSAEWKEKEAREMEEAALERLERKKKVQVWGWDE